MAWDEPPTTDPQGEDAHVAVALIEGTAVHLDVIGRLIVGCCGTAEARLRHLVDLGFSGIIVDLSDADDVDGDGARLLQALTRRLDGDGGRLVVVDPHCLLGDNTVGLVVVSEPPTGRWWVAPT